MKRVLAVMLVLAACGGSRPPKSERESPIVNEGSAVPETCCCKTFPLAAEDAKASYDMTPRMECSTLHGECVADVQCQKTQPE